MTCVQITQEIKSKVLARVACLAFPGMKSHISLMNSFYLPVFATSYFHLEWVLWNMLILYYALRLRRLYPFGFFLPYMLYIW